MAFQVNENADQFNGRAQIVQSVIPCPVNFNRLRHAGAARLHRPCHNVDHLVRQDWGEPGDRRLLDVEFQRLVAGPLAKLYRTPIFGDRDIGIVEIARVEDHTLRIGFGPAHAETVMEGEVGARHFRPPSTGPGC